MDTAAVILAAGQGTRMRSQVPKVLHQLLGQPLVSYAIAIATQACGVKPVVVIGHAAEAVSAAVGESAELVVQEPQLGTGHAVLQTAALLQGRCEQVVVTTADMPLLQPETIAALIKRQRENPGPVTMLTVEADDPHGFGRVVRAADGSVAAIVEEAQASPEELAIRELNTSVYCFNASWLWENLSRIPLSAKGEYYLTDLIGLAVNQDFHVEAVVASDTREVIGINTRVHLAEASAIMQQRINRKWMEAGVTLIDPARIYIEPGVSLGQDTLIWPDTYLQGQTAIGAQCEIGPDTLIKDTRLGDGCRVVASVLEQALVEDRVEIGPFAHLRKGAHLAEGVHMGNFGEVKNSYLGPGTKMGHFSYLGDAILGPEVNVGAGTITCNYDGERKSPTEIGANVFIGSDTMLVAPLKVGPGSRTGAGSVVTKDVPADTLVVGVPARAIRKLKK